MKNTVFLVVFYIFCSSCSIKPKGEYIPPTNLTPNYANENLWAALPFRQDAADYTPKNFVDQQATAEADVFWLYPTSYIGKKGQDQWYPPLNDKFTNDKTDSTSIKYQASIFNGVGKIYAPRYRQMHLYGFYSKKEEEATEGGKAYDLAYQDVKAAFEYYLKNWNKGRPIIIAGHSQGAGHGITLIKEFFDGTDLQQQFVAAYLVGWPVRKDAFKTINVCESPININCFCSWRTYKYGYLPKIKQGKNGEFGVTNPLSWKTDEALISKTQNKGGVLLDMNIVYTNMADAQVKDGVLWMHKPKFPGSFLIWRKNYHIGDLNFYWMNIRENVEERMKFFKEQRNEKNK